MDDKLLSSSTFVSHFIIGMLPLIMVFGNSMFIPLIPSIQVEMNLNSFQGSLILTVFSIPAALLIPFIGLLSDRFGRKKMIRLSLMSIMFGSLLSAIAPVLFSGETAFFLFLTGRFFQGVGAGGTTPMAMALIADLFSGERRSTALGALEVFNGVGKVVSPILGGLLALFVWHSSFYFYFALSLATFLALFFFMEEKLKENKEIANLHEYMNKVKKVFIKEFKWIGPIYFASGVGLFILFGMLFFLSFELEEGYEIIGLAKGLYLAIPLASLTVFSYWTGKKIGTDKNKIKRSIFAGLLLFFSAFSLLVFFHQLENIVLLLLVGAAGLGLFLPAANTAITSSVSREERGIVVSLYNMFRFIGVALGPIFFSIWMESIVDMIFFSLFLIGLSLVFILLLWTCIPLVKECA